MHDKSSRLFSATQNLLYAQTRSYLAQTPRIKLIQQNRLHSSVYAQNKQEDGIETREELLERTLATQEKRYGKDHPEVASALVELGIAYGELGDVQKKSLSLAKQIDSLELPLPFSSKEDHG